MAEGVGTGVSFEHDARPLLRGSPDVDSMQAYGLDLSSHQDVKRELGDLLAP